MKKYILEGVFQSFGNKPTYPGRIYGKYEWDSIRNEWILSFRFKRIENILKILDS